MILTFTDFGVTGPYRGQLLTVLTAAAPGVPIVELVCDAPRFDPRASAYMLAALVDRIPPASVVVAVVDPGVGGERDALLVRADGRWYVGPDNGLLEVVCARSADLRVWRIDWRPPELSASFHGRDLFAPVAARLCREPKSLAEIGEEIGYSPRNWPPELWEVVYVDVYGNCISGIPAETVSETDRLHAAGHTLAFARTFSAAPANLPFWYRDSLGLVEIAVNCNSAAARLGLQIGSPIEIYKG